jgi:hypothetical protein
MVAEGLSRTTIAVRLAAVRSLARRPRSANISAAQPALAEAAIKALMAATRRPRAEIVRLVPEEDLLRGAAFVGPSPAQATTQAVIDWRMGAARCVPSTTG